MINGTIKIQYRILNCLEPKLGFSNHMTTFNRDKAVDYWEKGYTIQTRQIVEYAGGRDYPQTKWETQNSRRREN